MNQFCAAEIAKQIISLRKGHIVEWKDIRAGYITP